MTDKATVHAALRAHFERAIHDLERAQKDATASMRVDGVHRPSNRGERGAVTSAGYLTAGLEQRLDELRAALDLLARTGTSPRERAVTGALVTVEADAGEEGRYYLFPGAPGVTLEGVLVISPESPVGRALWAAEAGDEVELPRGSAEIVELV